MRRSDVAELEARVVELERSEQLLRALDLASAAMIEEHEPDEVIAAIASKLLDLGLQTVVLRKTDDGLLRVAHLSMSSRLVTGIEHHVGVTAKDFVIDYARVEFYRRIVEEREAIYVGDTFEIAATVLPKLPARLVRFVLKRLTMSQMIGAPLCVGEDVWGVFIISSHHLTASDVSAVRLFAHQFGWALHKTQLVARLRDTVATMEATREQLVQSQKMEALGRLTGGIAHDFNNLLTGILMSSALAKLDAPEGSSVFEELDNIEQAALRASDLISQLMAFSRRRASRAVLVDLGVELERLRPLLNRVIREDVRLHLALDRTHACVCRIDRTQLEQVIINLVVNARDAMPSGGELVVSVVRTRPGTVADEPAGLVCLSIQDTGSGIPEELHAHLFDPFFTTKPRGQGTGLGLAVAYGIVKQNGGRIDVHSELGRGSRFDVWLPAANDDEEEEEEDRAITTPDVQGPAMVLPNQVGRILLVEDSEHLRGVIERCLDRFGADFQAVTCLAEARAAMVADVPRLVICDVVLPDGNGLDFCHALHHRHPHVAVIVVSGYTDRTVDLGAIDERGWVFLPKPFRTTELMQALHRALD